MTDSTRKTVLDLDVDLLEQAERALGTKGIKETIDRALREAVIADARRRTIEHMRTMEPVDIHELRREAWGE